MSEKEPKTTENPDTAQTDVAVPLHPASASTGEFQPDEEFTSEDKEPSQMENVRKQDAGKIQHEAYIVNQSQNETKDQSENYADDSTPALEKTKSNVLTYSPNSILDADLISGPSKGSYDKISVCDKICDASESLNCSKRRNENSDNLVLQAERMLVDEVPKSDIQNRNDMNQDESKIAVSFRIIDSLSKMETETYENNDIFPVKENQPPPVPITVEFKTEVPTEKDNDQLTERKEYKSSCSRYDKLPMKSDDKNANESKLERQINFEIGRVMSMCSPVAQRKGKSNINPCNTQDSERDRPSMVVTYATKSTADQPVNQSTGQFVNKRIFEARGEGSQNPRLNRFRGIVYTGGDEIEYLSEESSEPEIFITPGSPAEIVTPSTDSLLSVYIFELLGFMLRRCGQQMAKAPLFYCISIVMIIISMITLIWRIEDYDIYVSIIFSFISCIIITFIIDRGQWAKTVDEIKEQDILTSCVKRCKDLCTCSACCRREPQKERHSQYYHLEQEQDTVFKHEIADVSNIDPEDYPHMKFVDEPEIIEAESPDFPTGISPINVYGHASGNLEDFAAIDENCSQVVFKKAAESHHKIKSKSSSAPLKLPQSYEAEIRVQKSGGIFVDSDVSEFHEVKASKSKLKTRDEVLPKPVEIGFVEKRGVESEHNREEIICEHIGKNIACSCSLYIPQRNKSKY